MSVVTAALAVALFVAAWLLIYMGLRNRKVEGLTVYPFFLIYRLSYSRSPLRPGLKSRLVRAYGIAGLAATAFAMGYFYLVSGSLFLERYLVRAPQASAEGFVPLIPGVTVGLYEFIFILIAVGVAVLIHEFSHAIVSRATGVPVKGAGLLLMAFVPAAFVEPDEESLRAAPLRSKVMIYAAGVASNVALGFLFAYMVSMLAPSLASGITIVSVEANSPAYVAGLLPGMKIVAIDGVPVRTVTQGLQELIKAGAESAAPANVTLTVIYNGLEKAITVAKPAGVNHIGIEVVQSFRLNWLMELLTSLYVVNMGLALINAAPFAFPLPGFGVESDGGQMLREVLSRAAGRLGYAISAGVEVATLLLIISLLTLAPVRLP